MQRKNKITLVPPPARRPLPDYGNQHKKGTASIKTNNIKLYLEAINNARQCGIPESYEAQ